MASNDDLIDRLDASLAILDEQEDLFANEAMVDVQEGSGDVTGGDSDMDIDMNVEMDLIGNISPHLEDDDILETPVSHEQDAAKNPPESSDIKVPGLKKKRKQFKANLDNTRKERDTRTPSPEPGDSGVNHDMDNSSGRRQTYRDMVRFLHRDIYSKDQGFSRQKTEVTSLNTTIGVDELDRKRPAWMFAPETKNMDCAFSVHEDFSKHVGPSGEKFVYRLTLNSGHRLAIPSVVLRVFDAASYTTEGVLGDGLRFKVKYEPGVQSLTKNPVADEDQVMQGSVHDTYGDHDLWEIDSFKIEGLEELRKNDVKLFDRIVKKNPMMDEKEPGKWAYIKMAINGGRLYKEFSGLTEVTENFSAHFTTLKTSPRLEALQFLVRVGDDAGEWIKDVQSWWKDFMESHYPPMEPYYNEDHTEVDVKIGMPNVQQIGNHAHCMYSKETGAELKADFKAGRPIQFPRETFQVSQYERAEHWSSGNEFQAMFGAGIAQEYDYTTFEIARLIEFPHQVMITKTVDSWDVDDSLGGEMSGIQKKVREHYWMHVWLGRDPITKKKFLIPPQGTWIQVDPCIPYAKTHRWSKGRDRWLGYVATPIDNAAQALGPDFSIFVRKPARGRRLRVYSSMEPGRNVVSMAMLDPFFDRKTEERQLAALKSVCNVRNTHLQHIAFPLLYQIERWGAKGYDWRVGPDPEDDKTLLWESLLDLMVEYRGIDQNRFHKEIMKGFEKTEGSISAIIGAAGTAKTTLVGDCTVLLNLAGHRVWIVGEQQDAIDNIATAFWDCYKLALEKTKETFPMIHDILLQNMALRYESSALPDIEKVKYMVRKTGEEYQSRRPDDESFMDDPLTKNIMSLFAANNMADEATMDEEEAKERKATAIKVTQIVDAYSKVQTTRAKKTLRFPRPMHMSDRLMRLRADDVGFDNAQESDHFVELQERLRKGTLEQGADEDALNKEREKMINRVVRGSNVVFLTTTACGEQAIKHCGCQPSYMWMEEGSQITIPAALVALQHRPRHCCVVGDLHQIEPHKVSASANAAWKNICRSFLEYIYHKGVPVRECRIQFRNPAELFKWPGAYFYGGRTENGPNVEDPHPNKDAVRNVSLEYGIRGPEGNGALFFVVNVPGGVSIREEKGNSIENYGEAEAVLRLVERLVSKNVPPGEITIIAWYRGQLKALTLLSKDRPEVLTDGLELLTVGQSQGETKSIVILTVSASALVDVNKMYGSDALKETNWKISTHVKLSSRLCVAFTRAKCGVILVCNVRSLASIPSQEDTDSHKDGSAWRDLLIYAQNHTLITLSNLLDTNPRLGGVISDPGFQAKMLEKVERVGKLSWLTAEKAEVFEKRVKLQAKTFHQTGLSAPKVIGRKGKGSGLAGAFPGEWAQAAYKRQTAQGAVEHGNGDTKAKKDRRRGKKGKAPVSTEASPSGNPLPKRKAEMYDTAQVNKKPTQ